MPAEKANCNPPLWDVTVLNLMGFMQLFATHGHAVTFIHFWPDVILTHCSGISRAITLTSTRKNLSANANLGPLKKRSLAIQRAVVR